MRFLLVSFLLLSVCFGETFGETRKKAEKGDALAQSNLGVCYFKGEGMTKDYVEAVKWWRKAAEQGDADAQYDLGYCYAEGDGVQKDIGAISKKICGASCRPAT